MASHASTSRVCPDLFFWCSIFAVLSTLANISPTTQAEPGSVTNCFIPPLVFSGVVCLLTVKYFASIQFYLLFSFFGRNKEAVGVGLSLVHLLDFASHFHHHHGDDRALETKPPKEAMGGRSRGRRHRGRRIRRRRGQGRPQQQQ